jgi:hypothetical protein
MDAEHERVIGRLREIEGDARERKLRSKRLRVEIGGEVVWISSDSRICVELAADKPVKVRVEE